MQIDQVAHDLNWWPNFKFPYLRTGFTGLPPFPVGRLTRFTVGHLSPSPIRNLNREDGQGSVGKGASLDILFGGWSGDVSGERVWLSYVKILDAACFKYDKIWKKSFCTIQVAECDYSTESTTATWLDNFCGIFDQRQSYGKDRARDQGPYLTSTIIQVCRCEQSFFTTNVTPLPLSTAKASSKTRDMSWQNNHEEGFT